MSKTTTSKLPAGDFAVIKTGGKQYRVSAGQKVTIEKIGKLGVRDASDAGKPVFFEEVLLRAIGGNVEVGAPRIAGAKVEAKIIENFKDKTKLVFKYHAKARYKKKKGHRQPHTEVEIVKI
jgi:large subunit ribosomal protein L21